MPTQEEKLWGAASHISYLIGLPLVFPLLLYVWKRNQSNFIAAQAKQAVGLHLFLLVAVAIAWAVIFATVGFGMVVAIPGLMLLGTASIIFSVIAVIKISQGHSYHYPLFGDWVDSL